mmetsp:Transcript_58303/g.190129  ORF Transcript_58303/g.190129 Transcript_58303/m.190129 type:complete len:203 (+) Transcript_58303:83-691(+)
MTFPYDATYNKESVIELADAIMANWKTDASEVPGLDVGRLFATIKLICEHVSSIEKYTRVDKDMQALLAVATATSWFSKEQTENLDEWLEEVASPDEEDDWLPNFPEEETRQAVIKGLGAHTAVVTIDKAGKAIDIEYEGGNYGQGKHDGSVRITEGHLRIYDNRYPGKHLVSHDVLPSNPADLKWCMQSTNWDYGWDEEET